MKTCSFSLEELEKVKKEKKVSKISKLEKRIFELEKKVAKLEKENREKDELLRPLSIAVACLCMFKKEELDKE